MVSSVEHSGPKQSCSEWRNRSAIDSTLDNNVSFRHCGWRPQFTVSVLMISFSFKSNFQIYQLASVEPYYYVVIERALTFLASNKIHLYAVLATNLLLVRRAKRSADLT